MVLLALTRFGIAIRYSEGQVMVSASLSCIADEDIKLLEARAILFGGFEMGFP